MSRESFFKALLEGKTHIKVFLRFFALIYLYIFVCLVVEVSQKHKRKKTNKENSSIRAVISGIVLISPKGRSSQVDLITSILILGVVQFRLKKLWDVDQKAANQGGNGKFSYSPSGSFEVIHGLVVVYRVVNCSVSFKGDSNREKYGSCHQRRVGRIKDFTEEDGVPIRCHVKAFPKTF